MYVSLYIILLFISYTLQQKQSLRQIRIKEASLPSNKQMQKPNRNYDPPGQGGWNPFLNVPDKEAAKFLTPTLQMAERIESEAQSTASAITFQETDLIPQPYSSHLMPLSGTTSISTRDHINNVNTTSSNIYSHLINSGETHVFLINPSFQNQSSDTVIIFKTLTNSSSTLNQPIQTTMHSPLKSSGQASRIINNTHSTSHHLKNNKSFPLSSRSPHHVISSYEYPKPPLVTALYPSQRGDVSFDLTETHQSFVIQLLLLLIDHCLFIKS